MSENETLAGQQETAQAIDGTYQINTGEDGVHLTVFPAKDGGKPVREPIVVNDLKSKQITEFNYNVIVRAVQDAAGVPVKIADKAAELAEPEIQVLVDRDRMEASLQIVIPKNSRPLSLDEVYDKITNSGVTHGVDHEEVKRAYERPGARVAFAHGDKAVDGTDAHIKYHVDTENKGRPVELADGRVDFKDLNLFTVVNEGDVLAEKIPPTPGTSGTDVLGQTVLPKPGKDMLMPVGKNVQVVDTKIIAAISGQMQLAGGKLHVSPVIEVKADVDLSTGNIEFVGNVIIRGSVQMGFMVKADGNIDIYGSVSGGTVEGKNIVIRGGIQGMQRGHVKAKENLTAKFIENAIVSAQHDVLVSDTILHSRVNAGKKIIVESKRGFIAGGHAMAGEEIRAKIVGTHLAVATDLEVGINPEIRDEYQMLRRELKKAEVSLDQAQKALTILKGMSQSDMPPEKREMLLKLTKSQFHLVGQVDTMRKRITEIDVIFEEVRYGRIKVSDIVYPGVKIVIGTLVKPIREPLKFVSFYAEDGEIKIGSFR